MSCLPSPRRSYRGRVSVLAIVPARGGSKGIPRKNLAELAGLPLIAHTIRAGLASQELDRVIVSTDDGEIAQVARSNGADVPFIRPAELAGDDSPTVDVILHALQSCDPGGSAELVVVLQPSSPLRSAADIDATIQRLLAAPDLQVAISVTPAGTGHPAYLYRPVDDEGELEPLFPQAQLTRQSLTRSFRRNGAVYAARVSHVRATRSLLAARVAAHVMPESRSVNIDEPFDLFLAEQLIAFGEQAGGGRTGS